MKKLFTIALLFALLHIEMRAQWVSSPTNESGTLRAVNLFDANNWRIGGNSKTLISSNGGTSWSSVDLTANGLPLVASAQLDFHFLSALTGLSTGNFSFGNDELVLRTTNGGQTWTIVHQVSNNGLFNVLNDLFFIGNTGWAVGANGHIFKTTNGGTSWTAQNTGIACEIYSVSFPTLTKGFAASACGLLKTTDGGATWSLDAAMNGYLTEIQFVSPTTGFVAGNDGLKKTTDGGATWTTVLGGFGFVEDIWFADGLFGYLLGGQAIFKTEDGGMTWEKATVDWDNNLLLRDFDWIDKNHGAVVGDQGFCAKTTNGGIGSWAPIADFVLGSGFKPCAGIPQPLKNNTADLPAYTYEWRLNGQFFSNARNPSVVFPAPGTAYKIEMIAFNGQARDTADVDVTTELIPTFNAPVLTASSQKICRGSEIFLDGFAQWGNGWTLLANGDSIAGASWSNTMHLTLRACPEIICFKKKEESVHSFEVN